MCSSDLLYELLGDGRGSTFAAAFPIVGGSDLDLVPIEAMVLIEARIFRCNDRVLKVGRDLIERNKFVALAIGRLVNPGLQATLHLHCSRRWIDPAYRQKE